MTKASKPFGLLLGALTASLLATGCGGSSGDNGAEAEAIQKLGQSETIQGCGSRQSNRVKSKWTSGLFLQRCQMGYLSWSLGNAVNSSDPESKNADIALALSDSYSNHGKFCTSLERMYANAPGERGEHSRLLGSFGNSLPESQVKTKLSELMHCPAFFKEGSGRLMAIDVTERSDQNTASGNGHPSGGSFTTGSGIE